jgi:hypothetical protein
MAAALLAAGVVALAAGSARAASGGLAELWQQTRWGEAEGALLRQFGARATRLPWRLDYGDTYVDIVLRDQPIDGFRFIVYFQMDKKTGGLARIQIERPRHGANPPAFRAALAALAETYGAPDRQCARPPSPASGYQATAERVWRRGDDVVRAIFRDTTLEASEGCFDLTAGGPCGLTAQLLLRISPRDRDRDGCGD